MRAPMTVDRVAWLESGTVELDIPDSNIGRGLLGAPDWPPA